MPRTWHIRATPWNMYDMLMPRQGMHSACNGRIMACMWHAKAAPWRTRKTEPTFANATAWSPMAALYSRGAASCAPVFLSTCEAAGVGQQVQTPAAGVQGIVAAGVQQ